MDKESNGIIATKKIYMVDPRVILIEDGWNHRFDFSGQEDIENTIMAGGVEHLPPISLQRNKDSALVLRDGERRLRAVKALIKRGINVVAIPSYITRSIVNPEEFLYESLRSNDGAKKYLPIEEAEGYRRLLKLGNELDKIAKETGKKVGHIRARLVLLNGCAEVKKALNNNEIPIGLAKQIIETSAGDKTLEASLVKEAISGKNGKKTIKTIVEKETKKSKQCREVVEEIQTLINEVLIELQDGCKKKVLKKLERVQELSNGMLNRRTKMRKED